MGWETIAYLNVFRLCKFLRAVGNVMVLFVLGIVGFTWYAVVPAQYGRAVVTGPPLAAAGGVAVAVAFTIVVRFIWGGPRGGRGAVVGRLSLASLIPQTCQQSSSSSSGSGSSLSYLQQDCDAPQLVPHQQSHHGTDISLFYCRSTRRLSWWSGRILRQCSPTQGVCQRAGPHLQMNR